MKRVPSVALILVFACVSQSNAQLLDSYGIKLGLTSASQKVDYGSTPYYLVGIPMDRRIGFNAAIYAEWFKLSMFSVVTQVEYAQRGFTQELKTVGGTSQDVRVHSRNVRIDYLSIPLLIKASPWKWLASPYLIAGVRMDIRMSASDDLAGTSWIQDHFRRSIWGASAGIGLESHSLLPIPILLEFRYNVDAIDSYNVNTIKARNNAFDFWLGVAL